MTLAEFPHQRSIRTISCRLQDVVAAPAYSVPQRYDFSFARRMSKPLQKMQKAAPDCTLCMAQRVILKLLFKLLFNEMLR